MAVTIDKVPGIAIDVEDLIAVRGRLEGLLGSRIRRRASVRSGAREIRLRGRGMEYEESRAYVYGDDVRNMDWRVMARTGEAHTKVFAEEKERSTLIAIDLSPSMFFGTRFAFKSWAAAQVAAHLGWLASFGGERIGGLVASRTHHAEIRPGKTRSGLLVLFHHLARADLRADGQTAAQPTAANRLNFLLRELKRVARPGADIVLISDFMGSDAATRQALSTLTRHNQLYSYWISDDSETNPWPKGGYAIRDAQHNLYLDLNDARHQAQLDAEQREHRQRVEALCSGFNIPLQAISCNREITRQMIEALQSRV